MATIPAHPSTMTQSQSGAIAAMRYKAVTNNIIKLREAKKACRRNKKNEAARQWRAEVRANQ